MAPLSFVFLANRGNLTRPILYKDLRERLRSEPGCVDVRVRPSRLRPRTVEARVETHVFLGQDYPVEEGKLEIEFSYPRAVEYEYYIIEWSEASRNLGIGWHRDEFHPDLGETHFQLDHDGTTLERSAAAFVDEHPLEVVETRLDQLRALLPEMEWRDGIPSLPTSGVPTP